MRGDLGQAEPQPDLPSQAFPRLAFPSEAVPLAPGAAMAGPPPAAVTNPPLQRSPQGAAPQGFQRSPPPRDPADRAPREFDVQWRSKAESQNLTYLAQCTVDGNVVKFKFEQEVNLERVTITTPGEGRGPAAYSCTVTQQQRRPNGSSQSHTVPLCEGQLTQEFHTTRIPAPSTHKFPHHELSLASHRTVARQTWKSLSRATCGATPLRSSSGPCQGRRPS